VDSPRAEVGLDLDARHQLAVGAHQLGDADPLPLAPLGELAHRRLGHAALQGDLDATLERCVRVARGELDVRVVRVHPQLAAGTLEHRGGLAVVVGVGVGAHEQAHVLELETDLVQRALEVAHRPGLVHAGVDEDDPVTGGQRPGVAVRHARPRQRQAKPPHAGQDALAPSHLPASLRLGHAPDASVRAMATTSERSAAEVARDYFGSIRAGDTTPQERAYAEDATITILGVLENASKRELIAYFSELYGAFPDFRFEVLDIVAEGDRAAAHWRVTGTFAGPGTFNGLQPIGARIDVRGVDLITVRDGQIVRNDAYTDNATIAQQLGLMPPNGSKGEQRMKALANKRTKAAQRLGPAAPRRSPTASGASRATRPLHGLLRARRRRGAHVRRGRAHDDQGGRQRSRAARRPDPDRARPRPHRPPRHGARLRRAGALPSRRGRRRRGLGRLALLGLVAELPAGVAAPAAQALPRQGVGRRAGQDQRHGERGRRRRRLPRRAPARPRTGAHRAVARERPHRA
jgi:steroid delta-isomerase-like uncharacterized protein